MKVSFELDLDHTSMGVWADVIQAFGELSRDYPSRVQEVQSFFDDVMDRALTPKEEIEDGEE